MSRLEELTPDTSVRGILPDGLVAVVSVQWHGSGALELTYKTPAGPGAGGAVVTGVENPTMLSSGGPRPWERARPARQEKRRKETPA
jgi:hypothetical protein